MAVKKYLDLNGLTAYNNKLKTVYPKNIAYGTYTPTGGSVARKGFHYDLDVESSGSQSTYTYTLVDLDTIITDLSIPTVSASASYNDGLTVGSVTVDSTTTNIKVPTFVGARTDEQGLSREGLVPTATYTQATDNKFLSAYGDWRVPVNTTYSGSSVGGEESISIDANNVIWNKGVRKIEEHETAPGTFMVYYGAGSSNSITVPGWDAVSSNATNAIKGVNIGGTVTSGSVSGGTDATITDDKKAVFTTLPASTLSGTTSTSLVLGNGVTATTQSQGDNSTKVATTAYVDTAVSDYMNYKGNITVTETVTGEGTTLSPYVHSYSVTLPNNITTLKKGYTFKVTQMGTNVYPEYYSAERVNIGDIFIVNTGGTISNHITTNTTWDIVVSGIVAENTDTVQNNIVLWGQDSHSVSDKGYYITSDIESGDIDEDAIPTAYAVQNYISDVVPEIQDMYGTCDLSDYTPTAGSGSGYYTAEASGFVLRIGAILSIKMVTDEPSITNMLENARLRVQYDSSSYTDYITIKYCGSNTTDDIIYLDDIVTFMYDGTYFQIINIDCGLVTNRVDGPDFFTIKPRNSRVGMQIGCYYGGPSATLTLFTNDPTTGSTSSSTISFPTSGEYHLNTAGTKGVTTDFTVAGDISDDNVPTTASLINKYLDNSGGYVVCNTEEAITAKVAFITGYVLKEKGFISVKFVNAVPANSTLKLNNFGTYTKAIYYRGSAITNGIIKAGDIVTFVYDGSHYEIVNIQTSYILGNASEKTVDTSISNTSSTNLPTSAAVASYVDTAINNLPEPMIFSGGVTVVETVTGTSPNYTYSYSVTLPNDITALVEGYTFKVTSASGTYPTGYSGTKVATGDTFIVATAGTIDSHVTTNTSWTIIPSGDEPNGTVTEVATGIGLTGGPINSSGTIKANLQSETKLGANATTESTPGSVTTQIYPVLADNSGKLAVHVPWTDTHGEVTSVAGKTGAVTLSASDVGLGNVTNNAQVKGLASGTTSGHIVTWGSDGYTVADSGKSISTTLDTTKDTEIPTSKAIDTYVTGKGYVTTDTKNTTGSTANANKLYLVGATEQSANPQTYSQADVYATAGKLYSNGIEVVNLSDSQALTNKTYNGLTLTPASTGFTLAGGTTSKTLTVNGNYTLAGACAKAVDETLSNTSSTKLPTSHAVAIYLQNFVDDNGFNNRIGIAYDTGTYDSSSNQVNVSNHGVRLKKDGIYTVKITNNVLAGAKLKYTNTEAKPIWVDGAIVESNVITDGMTVTFRYTGSVFEAILLPITDSAIDSLFTS